MVKPVDLLAPRPVIQIDHVLTCDPDGVITDKITEARCMTCGYTSEDPMDVYRNCRCQRQASS